MVGVLIGLGRKEGENARRNPLEQLRTTNKIAVLCYAQKVNELSSPTGRGGYLLVFNDADIFVTVLQLFHKRSEMFSFDLQLTCL